MRFRSEPAAFLALALLATAAAAGSFGERLNAAQIQSLAPGTYTGLYKDDLHLVIHLQPNGTVTGTADGKPQRGTWQVRNGEFCMTVQFLVFSKTKCGAIYRSGNRFFGMFNKKGKPRLVLEGGGGTI